MKVLVISVVNCGLLVWKVMLIMLFFLEVIVFSFVRSMLVS